MPTGFILLVILQMEMMITTDEAALIESSIKIGTLDVETLNSLRPFLLLIAESMVKESNITVEISVDRLWFLRDVVQSTDEFSLSLLRKIYRLLLKELTHVQLPARDSVKILSEMPHYLPTVVNDARSKNKKKNSRKT
jgi:hypothetical protein